MDTPTDNASNDDHTTNNADNPTTDSENRSEGTPDVRKTLASLRARGRKPKPHGRSRPSDIERWERDWQCVKLRLDGVDWPTVVERLGYSSTGHAHDRFVAFMRQYPQDDVVELRELELARLDKKCRELEPRCAQGDPRAVEVWNKLSERRSKLKGLDMPERREVTVISDDVVEKSIRELREEMDRKARQAQDSGIDLPELSQ